MMPQWGITPFTCARCTQRLLSTGRPFLPGHGSNSASGIRIATPRIAVRHFETEQPVNFLLIQRHLSQPARPQPVRKHLPSSPPADLLTTDELAEEEHLRDAAVEKYREEHKEEIEKKLGTRPSQSTPLSMVHPYYPRPHEPHRYLSTLMPTDQQLQQARLFFATGDPHYVFTCASFRQFPQDSPLPEVAFLGRSNVGKSSLLNALFGRRSRGSPDNADTGTAKVSNRAGKTRTMNVFLVGKGAQGGAKARETDMHGNVIKGSERERWIGPGRGVAVVDMPGHGFKSRAEWGEEIVKYLTKRKQLRRVFVLVDSDHGLKQTDLQVLDLLQKHGVPHQIVQSKVDKLLLPKLKNNSKQKIQKGLAVLRKRQEAIEKEMAKREKQGSGMPALGEILSVSSEKELPSIDAPGKFDKLGINGLRWAIMQAAGLSEGLDS